jgi:hypothetical protein
MRDRDEADFAPKRRGGYGHPITVLLIVLLAFAARYWFNFIAEHPNNYGVADASEYLRNTQALFELKNLLTSIWSEFYSVLAGKADAATVEHVRQSLAPLKEMRISGAPFPLFLAGAYAIGAGHVDILNWQIPLFAQSIMSALTCGFIALAGGFAYSRATGYLAGLLAALYPAFIVNSGRLYSESFAVFLLSAIVYLTVRGFAQQQGYGQAFGLSVWNGICAATLQFTRSVMVIVSAALVPITFIQYGFRKGMVALIGLLFGFALIAAPWMALQKLAFGSASLVVDRVGNYNAFVGNNTETSGWLSYPYPDGRGMEEKSMLAVVGESIGKSPRRWLQLMEDKPLRLFKFPWNDFRTAIGPVEFKWQVLSHELLMVLAFIGATLGLVSNSKAGRPDFGYERAGRLPKDQTTARLFLLFLFLMHAVYLLFITVPRYNITAMPIVIIFAAAGITSLSRLFVSRGGSFAAVSIILAGALLFAGGNLDITSAFATAFGVKATFWGFVFKQFLMVLSVVGLAAFICQGIAALAPARTSFETRVHPGSKYATAVVLAFTLVALPLAMIPAAANGRWYEWKQPFDSQGQLLTQKIVLPQLAGRQLYLLIDADGINTLHGTTIQINGKPLAMPLVPGISLVGDFDRLQTARGTQMREGEWIYACMTESVPMRNADMRQWFLVPIPPEQLSRELTVTLRKQAFTKGGTIYGAYDLHKRYRDIPSVSTTSWEKAFYGVENDEGLSDPRFNMRVDGEKFINSDTDLSVERGLQTGAYNIRVLAGPPNASTDPKLYTVEMPGTSTITMLKEHRLGSPTVTDGSHKSIQRLAVPPFMQSDLWLVRCRGTAKRNSGDASLRFAVFGTTGTEPYSSPWTPNVPCSTEPATFDFAVPIQPSAIKDLRDLELAVTSTGTASGITEISNLTLQILKVPNNPIGPGGTVF